MWSSKNSLLSPPLGDQLLEKAKNLVPMAHVAAMSVYDAIFKHFPILRQASGKHSEFFLTIGGVFVAATRLNNLPIEDDRKERIMAVIAEELNNWNLNAVAGFEDCRRFFEKNHDMLSQPWGESTFFASDSIGLWIVLNILERLPEYGDESATIRAIGGLVIHNFYRWWDE